MDKVKLGLIGMGQRLCFHGGCVFRDVKPEIQVAAVCDNRPERLAYGKAMYEKEFGYPIAAYADYWEMYARAGLEAVYIASPNYLHRDMTVAAFENRLHVLCEKPMELSLKQCDDMIQASRKSGKILALFMQMHYRQRYHKVKELIAGGRIGQPAMVWCTEYRGPFIEMKDWVWEKAKSGGAIVEKNCHHYDLLDLWMQSEPTTVYASGNILKHRIRSGVKSEIIDNAWVLNDYANGARGMVGICFLATTEHVREFGVQGTEGRIVFSTADGEVLHVTTNAGYQEDYRTDVNLRGGICRDFVECVRSGREPLVTGERGKRSLLVPLAAEKSMAEQRIVSVSEIS